MMLPIFLVAPLALHGTPHLELGMTKYAVKAAFGQTFRRSREGNFTVSSLVDDGRTYRGVSLDFSKRSQKLVRIELSLDGQRACDRLSNRMFRRYGKPAEQDLISKHVWGLWKQKGRPGYVSYTGYYSNDGVTCWKLYQYHRGEG